MKVKIFNAATFRNCFPTGNAVQIHLEDENGQTLDVTNHCHGFKFEGDAGSPLSLTLELYPNQVEIAADVLLRLRQMKARQDADNNVVEGEVVEGEVAEPHAD